MARKSGSWMPIGLLFFFFFGNGMYYYYYYSTDGNDMSNQFHTHSDQNVQDVDWRAKLAFQHIPSLFSKRANTDDLGPLSLDSFRKNNLSASWKFIGQENLINDNLIPAEITESTKKGTLLGKLEKILGDHPQSVDTPAKLARRQLRDKRREIRAADLVKKDDDVIIKLENAAIERSKSVDSAVLGKYSIWRKENDYENIDTTIRLVRDQMIMARVYVSIAAMKNKTQLARELQSQLKESQRALGDATTDADLNRSVGEKIKAMGQLLSKAKDQLYDCKLVTGKLRAMLQSADEQVRSLKKQSMFLSQLAAKTIPNGIHCLSMRLTIDYYLLPVEKRVFPRRENLENPDLYHYALFSDNVLAASVVVNSTIKNVKEPEKHVFHLVSDKLNFGAMNMWFLLNPPGKATIHVENVDEFKWLNSSYCPVLRQLESAAMKEYYFKSDHQTTGSSNLKYRNPKYLSMLNHLRFYLPQVYPKLNKILFLDDDIVVQKDLTGLWKVDLNGKVNGAVETCGESFHRFDKYLNFSNPHIARNFDQCFHNRTGRRTGRPTGSPVQPVEPVRPAEHICSKNGESTLKNYFSKKKIFFYIENRFNRSGFPVRPVEPVRTGRFPNSRANYVNRTGRWTESRSDRFDRPVRSGLNNIDFDPNACGWAYGMNMFDLQVWKKKDITGIYHKWQNMNEDRVLWKLGTLPPGLMTFYGLTHPLDKSWHVLGLGYNPSIDKKDIEKAAVIHYNGNMKPWLELAMTKYRSYWVKYIKFDHPYIRGCKIGE